MLFIVIFSDTQGKNITSCCIASKNGNTHTALHICTFWLFVNIFCFRIVVFSLFFCCQPEFKCCVRWSRFSCLPRGCHFVVFPSFSRMVRSFEHYASVMVEISTCRYFALSLCHSPWNTSRYSVSSVFVKRKAKISNKDVFFLVFSPRWHEILG